MHHRICLPRFNFATSALIICLALAPSSLPAWAQTTETDSIDGQFRKWLVEIVWPDALQHDVSRATFDGALAKVTLDWSLPELQPPGTARRPDDQRQAEFQSPGRYFSEGQLASLARTGANLLQQWASVLDSLERRYGVPREILVAIWGRETHFGRVRPKHQALRVLATQAFMGRRRTLYYPELVAALLILEREHLPGEPLLSSWAGAMGQPQLLPSKFLRYAVDADGDGRRDIWRSVPDSLASIANYLREQGWEPGRRWGAEARVPANVSCSQEGPRQDRVVREWEQLGLIPTNGASLPKDTAGFLLMPAGRLGPAFLVSHNFYVLKQYNESDLYALFIGHLADRIQGASALVGRWSPIDPMPRGEIWALQERLQADGYDVGKLDGLVGFATRTAIGRWQRKHGQQETCYPDAVLIQAIR
jgi:lytic murein transglycosylase